MAQKESEIQNLIITYFQSLGWYVLRVNSGGKLSNYTTKDGRSKKYMIRMAPAGTPDLIMCSKEGRFIGVEVKRPGGKPTDKQTETLHRINELGGIGILAESLDEVLEDLRDVGLIK